MSHHTAKPGAGQYQQGLSYIEVMVATVLLVVALVPAMDALQSGIQGSEVHESVTVNQYQLIAKLEEVLAQPYNDLDAAATAAASPTVMTSYSDISGSNNRRLVFLSAYDGDNADGDNNPFTGVDDGLIWVRVQIENTASVIETLTSR